MDVYDFLIRRMGSEGTTWVQLKAYSLEVATKTVRDSNPGSLIIEAKLVATFPTNVLP